MNWSWRSMMLIAGAAACSGDPSGPAAPPGSGVPGDDPAAAIVLSPVIMRQTPAAGTGSVVFVSATPGAVPRHGAITIRNGRSGARVRTEVFGGGFDPVPVMATVGDEIVVAEGDTIYQSMEAMARARPRVIRVSPSPRKTDVPLNVKVEVVFSAPVTRQSVSEGLTLSYGGRMVEGVTEPQDAIGLTYHFVPRDSLERDTEYVIDVSGVSSAAGLTAEPLASPFRTTAGTAPAEVASISLIARPSIYDGPRHTLDAGGPLEIYAVALAQDRTTIIRVPVTITSLSPFLIQFSPAASGDNNLVGLVRGIVPGRGTIMASVAGVTATWEVVVYGALSPPRDLRVILAAPDGLWSVNGDGTNPVRLTSGHGDSRPMATADGRIVFDRFGADGVARLYEVGPAGEVNFLEHGQCGAWSPDGSRLVYMQGEHILVSPPGAVGARLGSVGRLGAGCVRWTVDGRFVGASREPADALSPGIPDRHTTKVLNPETGLMHYLPESAPAELDDGLLSRDGGFALGPGEDGWLYVYQTDAPYRSVVYSGAAHGVFAR